jgi:hypothetical protein
MSSSVLDKRPAKAATALRSSPRPGPLPGEPGPAAPSGRLGAVVALLTFAVFLPSVRNGWVNWDDADNFLGNPHFRYTLFHPVVPWSATYVGPALVVVGITALTVAARRRWPAGLVVWISYLALLLPMLGLLHNGAQITADRFTYA